MNQYFQWNIDQEIIHFIGPFGLRWYSLFFLGGILNAYHFFGKLLVKEGKPIELREPFLYYIVFGTIIGARLGHCLFYDPQYYFSNPLRILRVWEGGLASHGGFTGVIIATLLFSFKHKNAPYLWLMDRVAIYSVLAGAFIRVGNFFNSEIIGLVTDVPWAVVFLKVDALPRHPTQIYEALGYAAISLILYACYRQANRKPLEGRIFGLALSIAFAFRFMIENFKEHQVSYEQGLSLNMGQVLSLPFILIGFFLISGYQKKIKALSWAFSLEPEVKLGTPANQVKKKKKTKQK